MLASRTKTPVSRASGSVQIKVVRESPSLEPTLRFVFVILERFLLLLCAAEHDKNTKITYLPRRPLDSLLPDCATRRAVTPNPPAAQPGSRLRMRRRR